MNQMYLQSIDTHNSKFSELLNRFDTVTYKWRAIEKEKGRVEIIHEKPKIYKFFGKENC